MVAIFSMSGGDNGLANLTLPFEFYSKFDVREILGRGACSTVWKCVKKQTLQKYAVKIIDLSQDSLSFHEVEELRRSTAEEVRILHLCDSHPHIVKLYEVFESNSSIFLLFEICTNGELFDYLTSEVTLSERQTKQIMKQLLTAVQYLHSKNIVHRDIKPENILLDDKLNIKLSDFGFSTTIREEDELTDLCGTLDYLAPEVLKVSLYDDAPGYGRAVDLWACGVIMYSLLAGFPPFYHHKEAHTLRAIMVGRYSFANPEWDDVGEPAKNLISVMLNVDPRQRISASNALHHQFFKLEENSAYGLGEDYKADFPTGVLARRLFKVGVWTIVAMHRFQRAVTKPPVINLEQLCKNPYGLRLIRKIIDRGTFKIYGHWIMREDFQNRGELFQNRIKSEALSKVASIADLPSLPSHLS